jgi:large subunit ribosomal protein L27
MSHVKAGGSSKNLKDSQGQRRGVKRFGGETVREGEVIVRQVGMTKRGGEGTFVSKNFTIHAAKDGVVGYTKKKVKTFTGRSVPRVEVSVK